MAIFIVAVMYLIAGQVIASAQACGFGSFSLGNSLLPPLSAI